MTTRSYFVFIAIDEGHLCASGHETRAEAVKAAQEHYTEVCNEGEGWGSAPYVLEIRADWWGDFEPPQADGIPVVRGVPQGETKEICRCCALAAGVLIPGTESAVGLGRVKMILARP